MRQRDVGFKHPAAQTGQSPENTVPNDPARIVRPAWRALPRPTPAELETGARERDAALKAWQRAGARFDRLEPPLPVRWDNWREAQARDARKRAFRAREAAALESAREHYRDLLCRCTNTGASAQRSTATTYPEASPRQEEPIRGPATTPGKPSRQPPSGTPKNAPAGGDPHLKRTGRNESPG